MYTQEIRQLAIGVRRDYVPNIRSGEATGDDKELSMGLAAMAVRLLTGWDARRAGATVVDGSGDNGIDAIAADFDTKILYVVQAKWHWSQNSVIDQRGANKLVRGMKLLRQGALTQFNSSVRAIESEIEAIMREPYAKIVMVVASTATGEMHPDVRAIFDEEILSSNRLNTVLELKTLTFDRFYTELIDALDRHGPTVDTTLLEWGVLTEPYIAIHGRIAASELGNWYAQHGDSLFESNIRSEIVDSPVNRSIVRTLVDEPDNFWYFNNGVTVLCREWPEAPGHGPSGKRFTFTDVSIVNGAQTVASIYHAMRQSPQAVRSAQVSVRFIALKSCPEGFGSRVTYATNFQNSVDSRDFIALDPEQIRLRRDFKLDLGKEYALRRGDPIPQGDPGCSVIEALIALACAYPDVELSVVAKNQIEELWQSTETRPYRDLFHAQLTAVDVWRQVQILRLVDDALRNRAALEEGVVKEVAVEGNRIIAHIVFRLLSDRWPTASSNHWKSVLAEVNSLTVDVLHRLSFMVKPQLVGRRSVKKLLESTTRRREIVQQVLFLFEAKPDPFDENFIRQFKDELQMGRRDPILRLLGPRETDAHGYRFSNGRFLVLKDSRAAVTAVKSLQPRYVRRRKQLIDESALVESTNGTYLILQRDEIFDSPSDAATVMTGSPVNGREEWRTNQDMSLAKLEKAEMADTERDADGEES